MAGFLPPQAVTCGHIAREQDGLPLGEVFAAPVSARHSGSAASAISSRQHCIRSALSCQKHLHFCGDRGLCAADGLRHG